MNMYVRRKLLTSIFYIEKNYLLLYSIEYLETIKTIKMFFFLEVRVRHHSKDSDIAAMLQKFVNCTYIRALEIIRGEPNVPTNLYPKTIHSVRIIAALLTA